MCERTLLYHQMLQAKCTAPPAAAAPPPELLHGTIPELLHYPGFVSKI